MDYYFREIKYDKQSLRSYVNLLNRVFDEKIPKTVEFLDWEYNQNPLGKAYGYNAFYKDNLVAHYSAQPIFCNIEGNDAKGLLALHVATHPCHQGRGLFTVINNKTHEKAYSDGYEFVIGVANKNSTPRYLKSLGFKLIRQLDVKIGFSVPQKDTYSKNQYSFFRNWNDKSIKWRLRDPSYQHIVKENNGILTVFASTHIKCFSAIIYQMYNYEFPNIEGRKKNSINLFRVWLGIDKNLKWKSSINIPGKFKPSPLNLIYLNFNNRNHILNKNNILFNNLDFDVF